MKIYPNDLIDYMKITSCFTVLIVRAKTRGDAVLEDGKTLFIDLGMYINIKYIFLIHDSCRIHSLSRARFWFYQILKPRTAIRTVRMWILMEWESRTKSKLMRDLSCERERYYHFHSFKSSQVDSSVIWVF